MLREGEGHQKVTLGDTVGQKIKKVQAKKNHEIK